MAIAPYRSLHSKADLGHVSQSSPACMAIRDTRRTGNKSDLAPHPTSFVTRFPEKVGRVGGRPVGTESVLSFNNSVVVVSVSTLGPDRPGRRAGLTPQSSLCLYIAVRSLLQHPWPPYTAITTTIVHHYQHGPCLAFCPAHRHFTITTTIVVDASIDCHIEGCERVSACHALDHLLSCWIRLVGWGGRSWVGAIIIEIAAIQLGSKQRVRKHSS